MDGKEERTGILIRRFRPADHERIIELWNEGRLPVRPGGRDNRAEIERQTGLDNIAFFVGEAEGRIIATVVASHDGRKGWINRLAVDAAWRGRGVGRRMVEEAEAWFRSCGLGIFACLIEDWNDVSMQVFERLGYIRHTDIHYFSKRRDPGI